MNMSVAQPTNSMDDRAERLNKKDFMLLERVFDAEIRGLLPAQIGKSKVVASLHERGYIAPTVTTRRTAFGALRIEGWSLTHAGRYIYCMNCTEERVAEEANGR